ncbi:unnamed protein product [Staurois parvus]|uniref:Uncharacterized protein n=1 Tax=Staurois parvus TaxID=386267 RepID=A0ABN9E8L7_9NEOB|nr:unnamed protein product [Staurois parvus]
MTRDCGHSTGDDQRLRTFGEGGGTLTGTRSHFRGVVLPSSRGGFCDSWVPTAHAREALCFVNGPKPSGTCHVSQKTPDHSQSAALLVHAQWVTEAAAGRLSQKVRSCRREELSGRIWWWQKYRTGRFTFAP